MAATNSNAAQTSDMSSGARVAPRAGGSRAGGGSLVRPLAVSVVLLCLWPATESAGGGSAEAGQASRAAGRQAAAAHGGAGEGRLRGLLRLRGGDTDWAHE